MPPRRRPNRAPEPEPEGESPDRNQSSEAEVEADDGDAHASSPIPFYNTTFSAHRVSPLYLGSEPLTANRLQSLAQRLRDRLVGDVVRGVEVGLGLDREDSGIGRAGALEKVDIRWVGVADVLHISREDAEHLLGSRHVEGGDGTKKAALHISLRYEMTSCTALMFPPLASDGEQTAAGRPTRFSVSAGGEHDDEMDWEDSVNPAHFLSLPLLLLRMPVPLKAVVSDFLSAAFDCRVSPMRLGTRSLVRSWESWIRLAGLPSRGPLAKDMVLSLGFCVPPASNAAPVPPEQDRDLGLKSVDAIIPAAELHRFVAAGKRLAATGNQRTASAAWGWEGDVRKRRRLAGRLYEEGWEWRAPSSDADSGEPPDGQPFTEALACYLKEHLALDLFHPGVRVVKVACGGFVMSETRLKVFTPTSSGETEAGSLAQTGAVWELLAGLVEKAQGQLVTA